MNLQQELGKVTDEFVESIKNLFENKEGTDTVHSFIEGKTLYKKETDAGTFIIAKYIPPYSRYEEVHNLRIVHIGKEFKDYKMIEDGFMHITDWRTAMGRIEIAAKSKVDIAVDTFNLGYDRGL